MKNLFENVSKQTILVMTLCLFFGGIALAYFTNGTEPWSTIGGFLSGISIFGLFLYASK